MRVITGDMLLRLSEEARSLPRRRRNLNLHDADDAACHRLFNAVEPLSYIRPHRHIEAEKAETFFLVSGVLGVVTFTDAGDIAEKAVLSQASGRVAVDIPHGVYHTALSLESGTVFFEAKAGPYRPMGEAEFAPWAPPEGSDVATSYLEELKQQILS